MTMPRKTKIFYLIERLARAGTELHMLNVLERLDRSRFEPVLCCLNGEMTEPNLAPDDMPCHMLHAQWNMMRPGTVSVYRRLKKLIAEEKPDIVHSFLFVSNVMAPFAARSVGVRKVIASRGRMGIEWDANFLHRVMQRFADRRTDIIICKTQALKREICRVEKVPEDKVRVVPNGVDMKRFSIEPGKIRENREWMSREYGISPEGPLLVAIGNLKPIKGHGTFVEAAALLVERFPKMQVAIVGKGECEPELRAAIEERGLAARIHLPGDFEDVRPWMGAADLFVAPSLSEGMPNAVLEAMSMGLPPILSDIPGHVEAAGSDAWYFKTEDPEGLADALADALGSPDKRAARGRAGYDRIKSEFSVDVMVRRIESLYAELSDR